MHPASPVSRGQTPQNSILSLAALHVPLQPGPVPQSLVHHALYSRRSHTASSPPLTKTRSRRSPHQSLKTPSSTSTILTTLSLVSWLLTRHYAISYKPTPASWRVSGTASLVTQTRTRRGPSSSPSGKTVRPSWRPWYVISSKYSSIPLKVSRLRARSTLFRHHYESLLRRQVSHPHATVPRKQGNEECPRSRSSVHAIFADCVTQF